MKIEVLNRQSKIKVDAVLLKSCARKVLYHFRRNRARVCIAVVDNKAMKKLNNQYRKKNRTTDVLSFSMKEGKSIKGDRDLLGDIVISAEKARQKKDLCALVIHGMLHLLGFDHKNVKQDKKMRSKQILLLEKICRNAAC